MPQKGICESLESSVRSLSKVNLTGPEKGRGLKKTLESGLVINQMFHNSIDSLLKLNCRDSIDRLKDNL